MKCVKRLNVLKNINSININTNSEIKFAFILMLFIFLIKDNSLAYMPIEGSR